MFILKKSYFCRMKHHPVLPRQRILDTAFRLFHTQGYNATGINQVIAEAEVAKASLYQHFHSKEELAVAYLDMRHDYWFALLAAFTEQQPTPAGKILASFDFLEHMNETEDFRGCSFLNILSEIAPGDKAILGVIQSHKADLRRFFHRLLPENKGTADHIYLLFESAITESRLFREQWPVHHAKNIVSELLEK
jgi:AcrR family transcriptional regulator